MYLLESDHWRMWCEPETGVQWLAASVCKDGKWHAVVPDCRQAEAPADSLRPGQSPAAPLAAANFHMLPYSNRIRDGRFAFNDQIYQLANSQNHAIHGALRKLAWRVTDASPDSLICEIDTRQHDSVNWPWPMIARITQQIDGFVLSSIIELENAGGSPMPAGMGWHPYFVRTLDGSQPTLTLPVAGVFPDATQDCLPDGEAVALPAELDFRHARKLPADQRIDCCLNGLAGASIIHWENAGIKLSLQASDNCRYLILFNPDMPHFALEPVTNANDAFNLQSRGIESGTHVLQPGQSMQTRLDITLSVHN